MLVAVAEALSSSLRTRDVVGRWGGEEFLVLLPGANCDGMAQVATKLLESVRAISVPCAATRITLTITLGGATAEHSIDESDFWAQPTARYMREKPPAATDTSEPSAALNPDLNRGPCSYSRLVLRRRRPHRGRRQRFFSFPWQDTAVG